VTAVGELDAGRVTEARAASGGDYQQVVVIVDVIFDVIIGDAVMMTSHAASVVLSLAAKTDRSAAASR